MSETLHLNSAAQWEIVSKVPEVAKEPAAQQRANEVISSIPKTAAYEIILVSQMFHYLCSPVSPSPPAPILEKEREGAVGLVFA